MDKDKVIKADKYNKYNKHNKLESYNFLKSVKDKEKTVLDYYKRINSRPQSKPLPKTKKLTKKNLINKKQIEVKDDNKDDDKDDGKDDETEYTKEKGNIRQKPKTKIAPRGEEPKKYVIMD